MARRSVVGVILMDYTRRSVVYVHILLLLAIATLLRFLLSPALGDYAPFVTYVPVIVLSALLAGLEGGVIATVLSIVLTVHYFTPIPISPAARRAWDLSVEVYVFEGLLISFLGNANFNSRRREKSLKSSSEARAIEFKKREEELRLAIEGAQVGIWRLDIASGMATMSQTMRELMGRPDFEETFPTYTLHAVHPDDLEAVRENILSAIESHTEYNMEYRVVWPDETVHWQVSRGRVHYDSDGKAATLEGINLEITELKNAERDATARAHAANALNYISKAIRESRESTDVQGIALVELANLLSVDRCIIILLDEQHNTANFVAEWHKPDLADIRGEYKLSDFDVNLTAVFANAAPLVVSDIDHEPQFSELTAKTLRSMDITALIDVPLMVDGEIVGIINVSMASGTRTWTSEEVSFVEAVASQLRAELESMRILDEVRKRANREALINRIGDAVRGSLDPLEIQGKAVELLGEFLGVDRCFFGVYDFAKEVVIISPDWHISDLSTIEGVHNFPNTKHMFEELYSKRFTSVIRDIDAAGFSQQTVDNMKELQLKSRISVAFADVRGMAKLTVAMTDSARDWFPEEVELLEKVALLLHSALELQRIQSREHKIATDLQAALLPVPYKEIPGLSIGGCMQPAFDEAEIGGDFFDVFPLDDSLYAIVIGDVSGKGLGAAAQLATVRNTLRAYLYQTPNPADVVTMLNTALTTHGVLQGFVTLFVAVYDSENSTMTYSSCGHEPALLCKASGCLVQHVTTPGMPIGVNPNAHYLLGKIVLEEGDRMLFYTDGISEEGPTRRDMIETDGLIRLFEKVSDIHDVDQAANEIMRYVNEYAKGALRDDACLLIVHRKVESNTFAALEKTV